MRSSRSFPIDPKLIEQCKKLLEHATQLVGGTQPPMSATDRNRRLKVPKGGEKVVPILAALCDQYGLKELGPHTTKIMVENAQHAERMRELATFSAAFNKLADDSQLRAQTGYWKVATAMYSMLSRLSDDEPNLKAALAPVKTFFAKGARINGASRKRSKKAAVTAPSAVTPATVVVVAGKEAPAGAVNGASNGAPVAAPVATPINGVSNGASSNGASNGGAR